jgi:chromosome segregation ATPase
LENLAGVKELENRLAQTEANVRAKEAELREVRRRLSSVERDYQDQLSQQGRRITEGSGQVRTEIHPMSCFPSGGRVGDLTEGSDPPAC